ncbi:peptidyl-prolyl cis-trans isomerase CYP95-like isoform X2 [Neltuma alba]|uniref:peptidyl-prolyl cis-trans isomerase CYP95 isoform X2 n=1 Tax=Neltuma alba TaxID=207710 RepID=UPI0010A58889|nr:peptidyl-prolyl cis-trans isomerase CYP95-like isoform X2 [Prosopis alba]XP_028793053.1 peptidyl-prolyl cis-trans isomerase CYP95-like isoform X2 [Prosopis alba]
MSHESNILMEKNPRVFMDVSIGGVDAGRMIFELFKKLAPFTAENFRALCTGEKGMGKKVGLPLHYEGSFFYGIQKGWSIAKSGKRRFIVKGGKCRSIVKGGDFFGPGGDCGESIYGADFPAESTQLQHCERGLLSMAITDRFGLGSQFVITLQPDDSLDRFHMVFGKLIKGFNTLKKIEEAILEAAYAKPVWVFNCGECCGSDDVVAEKRNPGDHSLNNVEARAYAAAKKPRPNPGPSCFPKRHRSEKKCSCCFDVPDP